MHTILIKNSFPNNCKIIYTNLLRKINFHLNSAYVNESYIKIYEICPNFIT